MHKVDIDLEHVTKIEGDASIHITIEDGKATKVNFSTEEYKRFFTEALKGKSVLAVPSHLSRICGTCSNAHIMAAIEACEMALDIQPSEQTKRLRSLTMHGLTIRDHALHLYLFALPDIYGKDAFLDFDENDPHQHQLLHDGFDVKRSGNQLAVAIAGRSVHAMYPTIGGFIKFPKAEDVALTLQMLKDAREPALRCVTEFTNAPFHFDRKTDYMALLPDAGYGYIDGKIRTSKGDVYDEKRYRELVEHVVLPYSQASAYEYKGEPYMVGALARMNIAKEKLHPKTQESCKDAIALFPSTNIFHNNLAQAIEIVHSIDESIDLLEQFPIVAEDVIKKPYRDAVGIGVVEAPRGALYHKIHMGADGKIIDGEVIVPTGQNQINIEEDAGRLVEELWAKGIQDVPSITFELEKLIRAYDPCMSCGAHFLKLDLEVK
jgi:coenzyme F420-reducing hydrogenase alpha subunit